MYTIAALIFLEFCLFLQLENIGNFVRAIVDYGLKPHDIFEANDLFENVNHTQVQSTLIALAGMVRVALLIKPNHFVPSLFFCNSSNIILKGLEVIQKQFRIF